MENVNEMATIESVREHYRQIIDIDRTLIEYLRDMILLKEKKECDDSIFV